MGPPEVTRARQAQGDGRETRCRRSPHDHGRRNHERPAERLALPGEHEGREDEQAKQERGGEQREVKEDAARNVRKDDAP